jgi:hypothetical protein
VTSSTTSLTGTADLPTVRRSSPSTRRSGRASGARPEKAAAITHQGQVDEPAATIRDIDDLLVQPADDPLTAHDCAS